MFKFRTKIILPLFMLILIVFLSLGFFLGQLFNNFYIHTFEQRIEKEANLISYIISDEENDINIKEAIINFEQQLDAKIAIINPNGEIIGNENYTLDNIYENIPSVKKLIEGKITTFQSYHEINEEKSLFHYIMPLQKKDEFVGYFLFSMSVEPLENINNKILWLLISSFAVACILILMVGSRITELYMKPIEAATKVANELAKGNYKARTYENKLDETVMLSQSINILARNLQQMTATQEMQQDRLKTLIENMGSGVILIDGKGYINLVNKVYKEIFDIKQKDYLERLYYDAFAHEEIISLVEHIFMTEKSIRKQLYIPLKIEWRHFEVYGAPIIGTNEEWKGVVLVFHDITEIKKLEQMRKDFVANVSHELKTPITSIKGFTETLLDGAMEDKQMREYFLHIILKETDRLQTLINDLLDLSHIEQANFTLNITRVHLVDIIKDVIIMLQSKADMKHIRIINHVQDGHFIIEGDIYRIKQIFINVITNAISYTPEGGNIEVICEDLQNQVQVSVSDTGIGISKEEIPRIFERFYRVDKARSRNSGGTGLGLAIVKHLIEAHHGKIEVQSEVNKGTTFILTFLKKGLTKD